jgi:hypothetical protein
MSQLASQIEKFAESYGKDQYPAPLKIDHRGIKSATGIHHTFFGLAFLVAFFAFGFSFSGLCGVLIALLSAAAKRAVASLLL